MFACSYGAAFGAIQHMPRIVPGPAGGERACRAPDAAEGGERGPGLPGDRRSGRARFLLAFLAVRIVSRRRLLRIFQVPGLVLLPVVFFWRRGHTTSSALKWGIFLAGLLTVAQFSFWGNYLPRVYPTHLRGTGESFAANIGGRMIGTSAALRDHARWPT